MARWFAHVSNRIALAAGNYKTFLAAIAVILAWAITGPLFAFSDTWQLVINTSTTIVTFLMVFLIQNTQNRDALAVHLKLNELILALEAADDALMEAEDETDEELAELKRHYQQLCHQRGEVKARLAQALAAKQDGRPPTPAARAGSRAGS